MNVFIQTSGLLILKCNTDKNVFGAILLSATKIAICKEAFLKIILVFEQQKILKNVILSVFIKVLELF